MILNILKLEGYKMDSGELFQAFKDAGGEMENFKSELDKLSELGKTVKQHSKIKYYQKWFIPIL